MGLQTEEELRDVIDVRQDSSGSFSVDLANLQQAATNEPAPANVDTSTGEIIDAEPEPQAEAKASAPADDVNLE